MIPFYISSSTVEGVAKTMCISNMLISALFVDFVSFIQVHLPANLKLLQ